MPLVCMFPVRIPPMQNVSFLLMQLNARVINLDDEVFLREHFVTVALPTDIAETVCARHWMLTACSHDWLSEMDQSIQHLQKSYCKCCTVFLQHYITISSIGLYRFKDYFFYSGGCNISTYKWQFSLIE